MNPQMSNECKLLQFASGLNFCNRKLALELDKICANVG